MTLLNHKERWRELCEQAAVEQDPKKLRSQEQTALEEYCLDLYKKTGKYWDERKEWCATRDLGFGILYGPPKVSPPLLILATNPGYDEQDDSKRWPEENLFAVWPPPDQRKEVEWKLTRELIRLFREIGQGQTLQDSVPTNVLWFKSDRLKKDSPDGLAWKDNPPELQRDLEAYCLAELPELVRRINPSRILVVGMWAYDKIHGTVDGPRIMRENGIERLCCGGVVFGKPALATAHLTAAWGIRGEGPRIQNALSEFLSCKS